MRFIAKKVNDEEYEVIGLDTLKTINDEEVEVIVGIIKQNKEKLEQVIKDYQEETEFFVNKQKEDFLIDREENLKQLKEQLKAIENCK